MGVSWVLGLRLWAGAVAHVAGHKLIWAVVVGVQHGNVLAEQERARLQAHIDDQLGRAGIPTHSGEVPKHDEDRSDCFPKLEVGGTHN